MASERYRITRLKLDDLTKGKHVITLYKHYLHKNQPLCQKTVIAADSCTNGKIYCKYLADDGKYKFILFDRGVQLSQNTDGGSSSTNIPYSTTDMTSTSEELGYSTVRMITASVTCDLDKYRTLESIQNSPRVYIQWNDNTFTPEDTDANWLLCKITMNGNTFPMKKGVARVSVTITLPQVFSLSKF